jgi:hydrogenase nickel incorporation protein HypA/HybF
MHEMAIAQSVLEIATNEAEKHKAQSIRKIKLKIGEFSGVVKEALEFAFEVLKNGTLAENAELEIESVKLRVVCDSCGDAECSINDINLFCPQCNKVLQIISGKEMQVEYIDLD